MKEQFKGFYKADRTELKEIWHSSKTMFIFDTNCLLNLYRCENQTREDIIGLMRLVSDRIWIPFQVAYEYQRNRKEVIYDSLVSLDKVKKSLQDIIKKTSESINPLKKNLYSALSSEVAKLKEEISIPINDFIKSNIDPRINQKKTISEQDTIRNEIDKLVGNKCGAPPTQAEIEEINLQGEERFSKRIPPGYEDAKKTEESNYAGLTFKGKFGDLYLWMEIIKKAKEEEIENIIFICDDNKPDWWYIHHGETHGAHAQLAEELYSETQIKNFKMINQSTFLLDGSDLLENAKIKESSVKEMQAVYDTNKIITSRSFISLEELNNLKESKNIESLYFPVENHVNTDIKLQHEDIIWDLFLSLESAEENIKELTEKLESLTDLPLEKKVFSDFYIKTAQLAMTEIRSEIESLKKLRHTSFDNPSSVNVFESKIQNTRKVLARAFRMISIVSNEFKI